jgi:hypothetical protein
MPQGSDSDREKVVDLAEMRLRLRPPEPGTLAATLKNINDAFAPIGKHLNG